MPIVAVAAGIVAPGKAAAAATAAAAAGNVETGPAEPKDGGDGPTCCSPFTQLPR